MFAELFSPTPSVLPSVFGAAMDAGAITPPLLLGRTASREGALAGASTGTSWASTRVAVKVRAASIGFFILTIYFLCLKCLLL